MFALIFGFVKACTQEMFVEPLEEKGFLPTGQDLMETANATRGEHGFLGDSKKQSLKG